MENETITVSKKAYEELLEEIGILRNPEMMKQVEESAELKRKGVKPFKINV